MNYGVYKLARGLSLWVQRASIEVPFISKIELSFSKRDGITQEQSVLVAFSTADSDRDDLLNRQEFANFFNVLIANA